MAEAFHRRPDDAIAAVLEDIERRLLINLIDELTGLLAPAAFDDPLGLGILERATPSTDDVLMRLLPAAYADDEESASEFRRLTEVDLRRHKVHTLDEVRASLLATSGDIVLDAAAARGWTTALNDLRLAVGTRMGLDVTAAAPTRPELAPLYDWLTWLQGGLIDAMSAGPDTLDT